MTNTKDHPMLTLPAQLTNDDQVDLTADAFMRLVDTADTDVVTHALALVRLNTGASTQADRRILARAFDLDPAPGNGSKDRRLSDAAVAAAHADATTAIEMLWHTVDHRRYWGMGVTKPTRDTFLDREWDQHHQWRNVPSARRAFADYLRLDYSKDAQPHRKINDRVDAAMAAWYADRTSTLRRAFAVTLYRALPLTYQGATDPWFSGRALRNVVVAGHVRL